MDFEKVLDRESRFESVLDGKVREDPFEKVLGVIKPVKDTIEPDVKVKSILDIQARGVEDIRGLGKEEVKLYEDKPIVKPTAEALGKQAIATAELAMSVASGMLLYLPSKAYGLMALPFGREVADIAEEEIGKLGYQPFTEKGREAAELVGKGFELFLSPAHNIGEYVSKLSPRAGYVVELGTELLEFALTGGVVKKIKGRKVKFRPTVTGIRRMFKAKESLEIEAIKAKETVIEGIPDAVIKEAQVKILKVEKQQLKLELDALRKKAEIETVKEDLRAKGREVKDALRTAEERQVEIEKVFKEEVKKVEPEITYKTKREAELAYDIEQIAKEKEAKVKPEPELKPEPITNVDRQTGVDVLNLKGEESPFFQNLEETNTFKKLYSERVKAVSEDVELFTQKLINDVNRRFHGDEAVDIAKVRDGLSKLAASADEFRMDFLTGVDHLEWKETISEAATWARQSEVGALRLIKKQREGVELFTGIDPTQVKKLVESIKVKWDKDSQSWKFKVKGMLQEIYKDPESGWWMDGQRTTPGTNRPLYLGDTKVEAVKKSIELTAESLEGTGIQFYSGVPLDAAQKLLTKVVGRLKRTISRKDNKITIDYSKLTSEEAKIIKAAEDFHKSFEASKEAKNFDIERFLDRAELHTYRAIHERSGLLRNNLIKRYGKRGHKIVQYMDAETGSSGHSQRMYAEMISEAFKGVPLKLSNAVDAVNLVQRLKDIYGYKSAKEFQPPKGMNPVQTESYYHLMEVFHKLTPKERAQAEKASNIMFEHTKMWVDDMVKVGLKSAEEGELLKSHNYRKLRSINIQDLYDQKYRVKVGDKLVRQTDSGIDTLGKNAINMLETDHRILYTETANRIYRRIDNQSTKLEWVKFDKDYADNPYVIIRNNDRILKRSERKVPRGWVRDFWYDEGKQRSMYFHSDVALQLMAKGAHMSFPLTRVLTNVFGVNLTRFLAVGSSAAWALTRGLTMDVFHTFFSSRILDSKTGKWKRLYSPVGPKFLGQIGRDMGSTFYDVFTQGKKTGLYMKNGGMMPFLSMREQTFLGRGVKPPTYYDKFIDGVSYASRSMEMWNRVSVMERILRRKAKEQGITLEKAYKNETLVKEAVNGAVERLPYGQGGWLLKSIDKIFGPFISASYNATRTFSRGAWENPVDFAARIANIGVPTVGATIAAALFAPEVVKDTPEYDYVRSAVFPFFPDSCWFIDEDGDKIYVNIKLPLDPNVAAVYNIFRGLTQKMLYEKGLTNVEPNYGAIVDSITSSLPIETPTSPTLNSWFTYFRNMEPWRDRSIVSEKFPWPLSGAEGKFDPDVSQLAKDIGQPLGISPPRLGAAFRQVAPQNNEYVWALGKLYDAAFSDVDPRLRRQHWAKTISETPGLKNLMSITVPRAHRMEPKREINLKEKFDRMLRNEEMNSLSEGYHWKGAGSQQKINEFIRSHKDQDIRDTLREKDKFVKSIKDLQHRRYWSSMFSFSSKGKAREYYELTSKATPQEYEQIMEEKSILTKAGGFFTDNFWIELRKIRREKE